MGYTCNFCEKDVSHPAMTFNGYTIYTCLNCHLSKVYPTPDTADIYRDFSDNMAQGNSKSYISYFKSQPEHFKYFIFNHRIKPIQRYAPELFQRKSSCVVDVGCGSGTFLAYMKRLGFSNLWGSDFNSQNVKEVKDAFGIEVLAGDISVLDQIPPADLMVLYDVLEHVPDPIDYLRTMIKHLNDGGVVQIRVPNYGSFWASVLKTRWLWTIPPFHLNYFTVPVLKAMMQNAGYADVQVRSSKSGFRLAFYFLQLSKAFENRVNVEGLSGAMSNVSFYSFLFIEGIFKVLYFPIALVLQVFDADDCIEAYGRKKQKN